MSFRKLIVGALVLTATAIATPALAHMVEVTTALDMPDSDEPAAIKAALQKAVEGVLNDTIAFKPTIIAITDARVMGEKLLVRLLIADADGERMLQDLQNGDTGSASPDEDEAQPRQIKI